MKIALAQFNYTIADFEGNTRKIKNAINKAKEEDVDLVIFSELAICGYPPLDLLEQKDFILKCEAKIEEVARECTGIAAVVGGPKINQHPKGKKLFNAAFFLANGTIKSVHCKTLLPTYDIFDEYRYFEPNTEFNIVYYNGKKIAITICEDLWDQQPVENSFARSKLYVVSPMQKLMLFNPDFVINIAASPFSYTQDETRRNVLIDNARNYGIPVFYVNQIGAHTELIFDGGSLVLNNFGQPVAQLKHFEEDYSTINLDKTFNDKPIEKTADVDIPVIQKIHDALIVGIRDYFNKLGFMSAVLGLSGGIDSAVTVVLAVRALGKENVRVLLMPSKYSSEHSVNDAVDLAENLGIQYEIVNIEGIVNGFEASLKPIFRDLPEDIAEENIQARARGVLLMAISNKFGNILLNTSNKSEAAVGYGTLYGDMMGSISVLGDVYKTDVFNLAEFINKDKEVIPLNTITKPPSAELRPDQKDTDSLPDYDTLDHILSQYIEHKQGENDIVSQGYDRKLVQRIIRMVNRNEFKRFQTPPILRISTKAFGAGRRMPLVAKF